MNINLSRDQRGMAHLAIIGVVLVLAVGGAGYYVMTKQKDKTDAGTNTSQQSVVADKAAEEACKKEINDKDFCKFVSNWAGLSNYTLSITITNAEGSGTMIIEAESADKSRVTSKQGDKEVSAYVTIGNTSYTKDMTDGKWTKYTSTTPTTATTNVKDDVKLDFTDTAEAGKTEYKALGKEACGSLNCFKYQIIDSSDKTSEQFVWFDTKDYLLRRYTTKDSTGTSDMSISYGKVTVSEPSPIKEAPAAGGFDAAEIQRQIEAAMQSSGSGDTAE